jgi:Ni/Fe-hydrogenase 1 B-type cytochrome subunit
MATPTSATYQRVYVWQLPVRLYHWVNAICVFCLVVTGYLIGKPLAITYATEAYRQYWFGTIRFIHFVAAFVFFFNFLVRIYWGFVGNRYARWDNFIELRKSQMTEFWQVLKVDVLQMKPGEIESLGHNALAGMVYFLSFVVFLFQSLTGFALYSSMSSSPLPRLFHWIIPVMGGDFSVRQWHHLFMWFFVVFTIIHVYLVFYHDYVEGRGTASSMVGGWKFQRNEPAKR